MSYVDERAKKIFEEAYATIDRINNMPIRKPVVDDTVPVKQFTPVARRARGLDTMQQETEPNWEGWHNYVDMRAVALIEEFEKQYSDNVIEVMFARMDKHKQAHESEINELKTTIAELRGEVNLLRELLKGSNVKDIASAIRKDIA